jgi:hypothetical protein
VHQSDAGVTRILLFRCSSVQNQDIDDVEFLLGKTASPRSKKKKQQEGFVHQHDG